MLGAKTCVKTTCVAKGNVSRQNVTMRVSNLDRCQSMNKTLLTGCMAASEWTPSSGTGRLGTLSRAPAVCLFGNVWWILTLLYLIFL